MAKNQYATPDFLVLEIFLANVIGLLVENASFFKFKGVNCSYKKLFITITTKKNPQYCFLESTIIIELKKQQNNKFYIYS